MKTLIIIISLTLLFGTGLVMAQNNPSTEEKSKTVQGEEIHEKNADNNVLDKLQKDTEDISVMKPILFIAAIIEERLELHRLEKESIAAARSRDSDPK